MKFKETLNNPGRILTVLAVISCLVLFSFLIAYRLSPPAPSCSSGSDICNQETMELFSSRGIGTDEDPYIIENLFFTKDFRITVCCAQFAFTLQNCTFLDSNLFLQNLNRGYGSVYIPKNVMILNNSFNNGSLWITSSTIQTVANNSFLDTSYGLYIQMAYVENLIDNVFESSNLFIKFADNWDTYYIVFSNFVNNTIDGVEIGFFDSEYNITISAPYSQLFIFNSTLVSIVNQTISNTIVGVHIGFCSNFSLIGSNFSTCETAVKIRNSSEGNIFNSIIINSTQRGIFIRSSEKVLINNNTLSNNNIGIEYSAEYLTIKFNLIANNQSYAIFSDYYSDFCTITNNNFLSNAIGEISQAFDDGLNSDWDYNFWNDYISGNYQIEGSGPVYHYDHNPLSSPVDL